MLVNEPDQPPAPLSATLTAERGDLPTAQPADIELDGGGVLPTRSRDRYEVVGLHAEGGLGRVFEAYDTELARRVALKELHKDSRRSAQARFVREALITARLEHPSIVPVHEAGRWPSGEAFYSMKLVAGRPLSELIDEANSDRERLALLPNILAVADAVAYAHSERVIHRDLKPSNVIVGDYGETVVIDWGLAKALDDEHETTADLLGDPYREHVEDGVTVAGAVLGTPAYMPPEQARGEACDERADVYALGAILYRVCAGVAPYRGDDPKKMLQEVRGARPVPLSDIRRETSVELVSIVEKAMSRDRSARYPTATEFAADLKRFIQGRTVAAHRYTIGQRVALWARRHRPLVALGATALVVIALVGAFGVRKVLQERTEVTRQRNVAQARLDELSYTAALRELARDSTRAKEMLDERGIDDERSRVAASVAAWNGAATKWLRPATGTVARAWLAAAGALAIVVTDDDKLWAVGLPAATWRVLADSIDGCRVATASSDALVVALSCRQDMRVLRNGVWKQTNMQGSSPGSRLTVSENGRWALISEGSAGTAQVVIDLDTLDVRDTRVLLNTEVDTSEATRFELASDLLLVASPHSVSAVDLVSGERRWITKIDWPTWPDVSFAATTDAGAAFLRSGQALYAIDMTTGLVSEGPTDAEQNTRLQSGAGPAVGYASTAAGSDVGVWSVGESASQLARPALDGQFALSSNGKRLARANGLGEVTVTERSSGDLLFRTTQAQSVTSLSISPNGAFVLTAAHDGIRLWTIPELSPALLSSGAKILAASPGGVFLVVSPGGGLRLQQPDGASLDLPFTAVQRPYWSSPSDGFVLRTEQTAYLLASDGREKARCDADETVTHVALAPGICLRATATRLEAVIDGAVTAVELARPLKAILLHPESRTALACGRMGDQADAAFLRMYSLPDLTQTIGVVGEDCSSLHGLANGYAFAFTTNGASYRWEPSPPEHWTTRGKITPLFHGWGRMTVRTSANAGPVFASSDSAGLTTVVDAVSLREQLRAAFSAEHLALSPDGHLLAGYDGTRIVIWNLDTDTDYPLTPTRGGVESLHFIDDNRLAVTGPYETRVWKRPAPPQSAPDGSERRGDK